MQHCPKTKTAVQSVSKVLKSDSRCHSTCAESVFHLAATARCKIKICHLSRVVFLSLF